MAQTGALPSLTGLDAEQARAAVAACRGRRDEAVLGYLIGALGHAQWQVRKDAADILVTLGSVAAEPLKLTFKEGSEDQRYWVMNILARILGVECLPWLRKLYTTRDGNFRSHVLGALSVVPGVEAAQFLLEGLEDDSWLNRVAAAGYLEKRGTEVLKLLQKGFAEGSGDLKYWCLRLLVQILGPESAGFLRKGLQNEDANIRHYVIRSMEDVQDEWTQPILVEALSDPNWANRKTAATILQVRGKRAVPALVECLKSDSADVLYWAVKALATVGDERAIKPLERLLHGSKSPQVAEWVLGALASFRSVHTARILVEASYEFPHHTDFVRGRLLEFGVAGVRPLLDYVKSPNRDLMTFARGLLLDMGYPAMKNLIRTLDNASRAEYDTMLEDVARLPDDRLEDMLQGKDVNASQLHRVAASLESRALPALSTLSIKLDDAAVARLKQIAARAESGKPIDDLLTADVDVDQILSKALETDASDIHLKTNLPPIFRIQGVLSQTDLPPVPEASIRSIMARIAGKDRAALFESEHELDLAYEIPEVCRFRVNFYSELDGPGIAFRVIPARILSFADLKLPRVFRDICSNRQGLVLVTGPTGSGKSTTLAAMIDYINATREEHIITIEDPVEFRHQNRKSIITYRELGTNTRSFSNALRGALRQDPDVILVGEMRDVETMQLAIVAAETGHLVFSTLHTTSASETVDRILSVFPSGAHEQMTKALADSLRAIVCQNLVPSVDGRRTAAMEILVKTYAVANLIREEKLNQLDQAIIAGRDQGMQSRDDHLARLLKEHVITRETALAFCLDRAAMEKKLRAVP